MLSIQSLSKIYDSPSGQVEALKDASFEFPEGKITAIMGPSGSGKSTLLNLMAGFDKPTAGQVLLDGKDLGDLNDSQRAEMRLHTFGFVFQSFNLVQVLSAWQNIAFPMALADVSKADRKKRALALLERFGLADRPHHLPFRLSGGERQRVSLARALANNPKVVFADEPTGNLDSKSGKLVLASLKDVSREGRTVIVVTHDHRLVDEVDVVVEMLDGVLSVR